MGGGGGTPPIPPPPPVWKTLNISSFNWCSAVLNTLDFHDNPKLHNQYIILFCIALKVDSNNI